MKRKIVGLLFAMSSALCLAEQFEYQTGMVVNLGESWNPGTPFTIGSLNRCLDFEIDADAPVATEKYSESFAENFYEFKKATNLSFTTKGSANFGLAKLTAAASYQDIREIFKDNKSVVYVVTGKRTYNPVRISKASLSTKARNLLQQSIENNTSEVFYKSCGEAIVTSIAKETNISLAYIFTASNSSLKKKIKAAISAAVSSANNKGSSETNIMSAVAEVDKSVNVQVEIVQAGTIDNSDSLKSIVGIEPGDIKQVRTALQTAINSISWKSSQISRFTADKFSRFFNIPAEPSWQYITKAYTKLDRIRSLSDIIVTRYLQLEDVLSDAEHSFIKLLPGMDVKIEDELYDLEDKLDKLLQTARDCFETKTKVCRIPRLKISNKILHFVDVKFGGFSKWGHQLTAAHYDSHSEIVAASAIFWPEFVIQNVRYLRSISLRRNNQLEVYLDAERLIDAVSEGKLSLKPFFNLQFQYHSYCWRGEWGQKCAPWAKDGKRHINTLKSQGRDHFELLLTDIEGNTSSISIPKLSEATF